MYKLLSKILVTLFTKVVTCDITFKKMINITVAKAVMKYENKRTNSSKYIDVIKIFLTLNDFEPLSLWLLTLQDRLRTRLLRLTTTDSRMTGLLTLREQSDLPTLNGLV